MFEVRPIGTRTKFKPVKKPASEIPSVELVTELVEVQLEELRFYIMVSVQYAPFGVADGDMHPRQDLPTFFLSSMTTALWEDTAPSFSRGAYVLDPSVVTFALPSVACFI